MPHIYKLNCGFMTVLWRRVIRFSGSDLNSDRTGSRLRLHIT